MISHQTSTYDPLGIHQLFPEDIVCASLRIGDDLDNLFPQEEEAVASAVICRRMEFAAGRSCARIILKQLGFQNAVLIKKPDGTPSWPEGVVGSISHTHTWCAVAATRSSLVRGIGIDIESISRISAKIIRKITTEEERIFLWKAPPEKLQMLLCLIFSAKEAVYKCLYPVWKKKIGFHDVTITLEIIDRKFDAFIKPQAIPHGLFLSGNYKIYNGLVITGLVLPL